MLEIKYRILRWGRLDGAWVWFLIVSLLCICQHTQSLAQVPNPAHTPFDTQLHKKPEGLSKPKSVEPTQDQSETAYDDLAQGDTTSIVIVKGQKTGQKQVERGRPHLRDQLESSGVWGVMSGGEGSRLEVQVRGAGGHQSGLFLDDIPLHSLSMLEFKKQNGLSSY